MSTLSNPTSVESISGSFPKLVFVNGEDQRVITLDHASLTIGRQEGKDVVVADVRASRDHAVIQPEGSGYVIVDLGSTQGTYVNGEKVQRRKLAANDRLEFGARGGPYLIFDPTKREQIEAVKELTAASRVSIFSKLSPAEIEELGRIITVKKYAPDTAIFFQGEPSDSMYMLLSGCVKVIETSPEGREKILDILGAGEIVGELAMLDGHPRSATVTTCEPTELASLSHKDFRLFAAKYPEILWKITAALCERIRKTSTGMLELSSREAPHRLLAALNQLVEKHGQVAADGTCLISLKFGVQELAAMIGATPEVVSRLLQRYEGQGLIEMGRNKQFVVPDPQALARALQHAAEWS